MTHHLEEIPTAFDRTVLLAGGRIVGAGPIADQLTDGRLSDLYGVALEISHRDGRWSAVSR